MTAFVDVAVQRKPNRHLLGACLALSAEDLSFVDSGTERLAVKKTKTEGGLIVEIRRAER